MADASGRRLLRFHYAGRIPNGKGRIWDYGGKRREVLYTDTGEPDANGKVWDSRQVGRWQLPGPFVPYIWLGGPGTRHRVVCRERPRLEPGRRPAQPGDTPPRGNVTSLIVRMVSRPVVLYASSNRDIRADGHAGQADARKAGELPPLVDGTAEREDEGHGGMRLHGGVLLLGRRGALLRLSSGVWKLRHLRRVARLAWGRSDGPGLCRQVARPVHGSRVRAAS